MTRCVDGYRSLTLLKLTMMRVSMMLDKLLLNLQSST